jgi:hypothetical protein
MSKGKHGAKGGAYVYNPASGDPFRISRSKIELYVNCPRCFYLDRRQGIVRPPSYPFTLNNAVDLLLKREFDVYRQRQEAHPLMIANGVTAIPLAHPEFSRWRDPFRGGIVYRHTPTNLNITGVVDDVWVNERGELLVVDYKATARAQEPNLSADWQEGYKRQAEVYQWLLRKNGFSVSDTAYFVYCNGDLSVSGFHAKLEFKVSLLPYSGKDVWVEKVIREIHDCLNLASAPEPSIACTHCAYHSAINEIVMKERGLSGERRHL